MFVQELEALFDKYVGKAIPEPLPTGSNPLLDIKREVEELLTSYALYFPVTVTHDLSGQVLITLDYPPNF